VSRKRRRWIRWLAAAAGLAALAVVGVVFFAPKPSTALDEMVLDDEAVPVSTGTFSGADAAHDVSGTITVYRSAAGEFLHFEGYDATDGPDVSLYLSPSPDGTFDDASVRIPAPNGVGDGHLTLRGNFNVPLPASVDITDYKSAIIWCRRFSVKFGQAPLRGAS
jgi:hypothetical protein